MASTLYLSCLYDMATGAIDFDTDTFYGMLTTSSYTPSANAHTTRADITNEVTGTGYTAKGQECTIVVTKLTGTNRISFAVDPITWAESEITAAKLVIYKYNGGTAGGDPLVGCIEFGGNRTSTGGDFVFTESAPFYLTRV
jgi:hypothetical protein